MLLLKLSLEHVTVTSQERLTQSQFAHNVLPNVFLCPVVHQLNHTVFLLSILKDMSSILANEHKSLASVRLT